ncbi:hypothetical protein IRJ34_20055 [Paenarthrobacter sp. GOM3]|uniref:hypothetical protein n=1 Tax=Paenarthrobacter sp. GOM3 TaxID=2782567 RepID=UPI00295BF571|nr:hypothetical protein [Paenarthrobacter sp. GOM3]WOH18615.1 hypothetical protein IRJ34_20055 [Paenarthrobacter sp. GOM3]
MSYDLTVYCPGSPSVDQVRLLVGNIRGLHADPTVSKDDGVVVLRGVKRGYSFTVDGPFSVEAEDLPEEITAVLPDAATLFQVLVEGTQEAEIPHGVRFARKLAKGCHGVVMDEQTGEIWPQLRIPHEQTRAAEVAESDEFWLSWYLLEEDLPPDFLQRYLRIAGEVLPQAVPERYGTHEPFELFDSTGSEGFVAEYYGSEANKWEVHYRSPLPVTAGTIDGPQMARGNPFTQISLCLHRPALVDDGLRAALRQFFVTVADELEAVFACAEVRSGPDMLRSPNFFLPPLQWVGFPPYPLCWVWVGRRLQREIGPFLGPNASNHNGGLFRAFSDTPLDRHALTKALGPENLPWIPVEYSAAYPADSRAMAPLAPAKVIPEILRNREPLDLPPGIYNPPRKA